MRITRDEIEAAIREAATREPHRPANVLRAKELQDMLGWGHTRVHDWLRQEIAAGRCEPVKHPHRDLSGRVRRVEAYRFLELPE